MRDDKSSPSKARPSSEHQTEPRAVKRLADLNDVPRWVAWEEQTRHGKPTKVPINPHSGRQAATDDPKTWGTRAEAEQRWRLIKKVEIPCGVGLVLGDLGNGTCLMGIDLDQSIDPKTHGTPPWADRVLSRFDSYAEISPSGKGIKIFFLIKSSDAAAVDEIMGNGKRRTFAVGEHQEIAIDRLRYYAITERLLDGSRETFRIVDVDDIRWFFEEGGPQYQRDHGITPKADKQEHDGRDDSGSGHGFRFIAKWKADGYSFEEMKAAILDEPGRAGEWAKRVDERQLERAWENAKAPKKEKRPLTTRSMDQFDHREVAWLWWPFVPLREITAIYGDGDVGKTTITLDIAARTSTGEAWPEIDNQPEETWAPSDVLIICQEDDSHTVIRPRLEAAGANLKRVHQVGYDVPGDPDSFDSIDQLNENMAQIEAQINKHQDVKLIIINPITDFTGGTDTFGDDKVRSLLRPLVTLARRYDLAILYVLHLNKKEDMSARSRALGSVGFINVPRSAVFVGHDRNDSHDQRRFMVQDKKNLTPSGKRALGFTIQSTRFATRIVWENEWTEMSADDVLAKPQSGATKQDRAEDLLRNLLADGPRLQKDIESSGQAAGLSKSTLERAKKALRITSDRREQQWWWCMPGA
jgi:putative DNA primase/helicase